MRRLIFLAFILFLTSGPSLVAQDVRYNFDSKADFTKFKTYRIPSTAWAWALWSVPSRQCETKGEN